MMSAKSCWIWVAVAGLARQKDQTDAVLAGRRQRGGRDLAEEAVRHLEEDAGAVARVHLAAAGAAMLEVLEHRQRLVHDLVGGAPLHVDDEADAAGVVLVLRIVQAGGRPASAPRKGEGARAGLTGRLRVLIVGHNACPGNPGSGGTASRALWLSLSLIQK